MQLEIWISDLQESIQQRVLDFYNLESPYDFQQPLFILEAPDYHVCERCGCVRWVDPKMTDKELREMGLASCHCPERPVNKFEEIVRSYREALDLRDHKYEEMLAYYKREDATDDVIRALKIEYNK